jgi:hypothetical protein
MSTKLEQVLALSTGRKVPQAITLPEFPALEGPSASQILRFNEAMRDWKRKAEQAISEQIVVQESATAS